MSGVENRGLEEIRNFGHLFLEHKNLVSAPFYEGKQTWPLLSLRKEAERVRETMFESSDK